MNMTQKYYDEDGYFLIVAQLCLLCPYHNHLAIAHCPAMLATGKKLADVTESNVVTVG